MKSKLIIIALLTFTYFSSLDKSNGKAVVTSNTTLTTCNIDLIYPGGEQDPPAAPSNLTLTVNQHGVNLRWDDNSTNESGFIIERATVRSGSIGDFATLSRQGDAGWFVDSISSRTSGNTYHYRVRSYNESGGISAPSNVKAYTVPIIMANRNFILCSQTFLDPGAYGNYPNNVHRTSKVVAGIGGAKLSVKFSLFKTEVNDYLYIYDGTTTSARLIGRYSGNALPPVITSTNASGALTFKFISNGSIVSDGWEATFTCVVPATAAALHLTEETKLEVADKVNVFPTDGDQAHLLSTPSSPAPPTNLTLTVDSSNYVALGWEDNSTNETGFIIERATSETPDIYSIIGRVSENTRRYTDIKAYSNHTYHYRVKSFIQSGGESAPSNVKTFTMPIFMNGGSFSVCGESVMDPGGFGNYSNNANYVTTFYPARAGYNLLISFRQFGTESNRDYLYIYDGASTSARLIGRYSGNQPPPAITATRGALTFKFTTNGTIANYGWSAHFYCVLPGSPPILRISEEESIEELSDKVNVFPNPTSSSFKIQLPGDVKWTGVNMIDSEGNRNTLLKGEITQKELEFNVANKKKGLYILELISNESVVQKKLSIN